MRDILEELASGEHDPVKSAQEAMRPPLPKRFYKTAAAVLDDTGAARVELDGRTVKTPARSALELPSLAAAQLIADEFEAQSKEVDPARMPVTRLANTAIDGVAKETQAVFEDVLRFAGTDLLCYRAGSPEGLIERQTEHWDPHIDWLRTAIGANFSLAEGVMHVEQPREAIAAFSTALRRHDGCFALTCIHQFTTLTGSAILALAIAEGFCDAQSAWNAAHVDEDWNIEQWGEDADAKARRAARQAEMMAAAALFEALGRDV